MVSEIIFECMQIVQRSVWKGNPGHPPGGGIGDGRVLATFGGGDAGGAHRIPIPGQWVSGGVPLRQQPSRMSTWAWASAVTAVQVAGHSRMRLGFAGSS